LARRDSAVIGWNALVPVGLKALEFKPFDRTLRQEHVLKTTA
jgi:hypothetical protein